MRDFLLKKVLPDAASNLLAVYESDGLPSWAKQSMEELVDRQLIDEINNRFFKTLKFGTGGIRSRTVGSIITDAEKGSSSTQIPEFASVGTAYLNDFTIIGATMALFSYCKNFLQRSRMEQEIPSVVIAHDNRHFSRHFSELVASSWQQLGGRAMVYSAPRSTPQLSFSVRRLRCTAGVMITASHNPWHDNGFKAYFSDGAQMVDPHAAGVIAEFDSIKIEQICQLCEKKLEGVVFLGEDIDEAYKAAVCETILRGDVLSSYPISVAFSPLHGVGGVATIPLLVANRVKHFVVEEQNDMDSNFSTVKSPNPENREALALSIALAEKTEADIVLATDPDGDRLAVAARNCSGKFECLTGNVTGALLAEYRISQLKFLKSIPTNGSDRAAIIKTFVSTPLLDKIAKQHGVKCINTLTGFKWIGEKMLHYERAMLDHELKTKGAALEFDSIPPLERRELLINNSTLFIFGCEESYGCLAADNVRDKDANSACLMVCELAAYAKSLGQTLVEMRDNMYLKYGYFGESVLNINYEGASGAQKIHNILSSYRLRPPNAVAGNSVLEVVDFANDNVRDADEKLIPAEEFFFITLEKGIKFAVRASGTEPKIKFYLFLEHDEKVQNFEHLEKVKLSTAAKLEELKIFLTADTAKRANFSS